MQAGLPDPLGRLLPPIPPTQSEGKQGIGRKGSANIRSRGSGCEGDFLASAKIPNQLCYSEEATRVGDWNIETFEEICYNGDVVPDGDSEI